MEMVRTVFSPKCWATSNTNRGAPAATAQKTTNEKETKVQYERHKIL
jgi:hypothetical protein